MSGRPTRGVHTQGVQLHKSTAVGADADLTRDADKSLITLEVKIIKVNSGLQLDGAWSANHQHPC